MVKRTLQIIASSSKQRVPLEVTAVKKNGVAHIGIKGYIYGWNETASSSRIEEKIKAFKKEGITKARVYINSGGGDVFEANEILNLIEDNFTDVKVKVGALAASAGTIFLTKYHSTAKSNSQFMIHKPMGNPRGNEDEIAAGLQLIKNVTADYKKMYAKKMGITEAAVEELWKVDYWMTAKQALKKGLINAIEDVAEPIDATTRMQLVACGAPNIPKITNTNTNNPMELSVIAVRIGLQPDATQAQVDTRLKELTEKSARVDAVELKAKTDAKAAVKAQKKTVLDAAEADKKITAKQRPHLEGMSLESLEAYLEDMPSIDAISNQLNPQGEGEIKKGQEKWTYADYLEKDNEAFEKLPDAKQKELIDAHYKE